MSKTVQLKRGNANVSATYVGAEGEITVNTTDFTLNIHDGLTPGGYIVTGISGSNLGNLNFSNQTITGINSSQDINVNVGTATFNVQGPINVDGAAIIQGNLSVETVNANYFVGNGYYLYGVNIPSQLGNLTVSNQNLYGQNEPTSALILGRGNGLGNVELQGNVYSIAANIRNITAGNIVADGFTTLLNSNITRVNASGILSSVIAIESIGNVTKGYFFTTNSQALASNVGLIHRNQSFADPNVSLLALNHDTPVATFYSNGTNELTGNLVVVSTTRQHGIFSNAFMQIYSNVNSYSQLLKQNLSEGTDASTDLVLTSNNGTDSTFYVDLGIAGNLHADSEFFGDTTSFNDAYLYVTGYDQAGPSTGNIGNLIIGSTNGIVKTFIGNTAEANVVTVVTSTGLLPGANVVYSLGSSSRQWKDLWVSNNTIYLGGVSLSVSADGNLLVNGNTVSGGGNANVSLGNFVFSGNNLYNLNGGSFNNGDLSHGPTASLTLPVNGLTDSIALQNTYGNITLGAGANASITSSWLFNNNGILTLPGGAVAIGSQYGSEAILATDTSFGVATQGGATTYLNWSDNVANTSVLAAIYVNSPGATAGNIQIRTGNVGSPNSWLFGTTGNLELPSEGNIVGITPYNAGYIKWVGNSSGDGYGFTTMRLIPDETRESADSYLIIDPTGPNHIHIRAGGAQDNSPAQLYLGGETSHFKVDNGLNPDVYVTANNYKWTFGAAGNLTLPGDNVSTAFSRITSLANSSGDGAGYTTMGLIPDINLIGSDQFLIIDPTAPGHIHIRAGGTQDNSYADLILGGENSYFKIAAGANAQAQISANSHSWTFGVDGTFTLPTDAGLNGSQINSVSNSSGDLNGYTTLQLIPDVTLGTGTDQYLIIDPTAPGHIHIRAGGTQDNSVADLILGGEYSHVRIPAGANSSVYVKSNDNNWTFRDDGWTILPGSIYSENTINLETPGDFNPSIDGNILMYAGKEFRVVTNNAISAKTWTFEVDGNLTLPSEVAVIRYSNGTSILSGLGGGSSTQISNGNTSVTIPTSGGDIIFQRFNTNYGRLGNAVAIGITAGNINQSANAVAIGTNAGQVNQGEESIAIGRLSGNSSQGTAAVSMGRAAGRDSQGIESISIGADAGQTNQGAYSIAIGSSTAYLNQGTGAVAIGASAGAVNQGNNSVALGTGAGSGQVDNSIVVNANGSTLTAANPGLYIDPVRNDTSSNSQIVTYNTSTKELTYTNTISLAGNISAQYFAGNGSLLTGVDAENSATIDILNTNGLSTVFYPTFVEDRTNGQILRADVDLTYRTDDNILTVQNISSSGNISAAYFIGNGALLTGISAGSGNYGNSNVSTFLASFGSNSIVTTGNITGGNLSVTGNIIGNVNGFTIGYRDIPQVTFTSNATLALTDAGKHYFSTNSANVITVPNNATVSFNIGAAISIVQQGTGNLTISPAGGVTMYLAGNSTSSSRLLGNYGMATLMKVGTDTWFINGTGLT